MNVPAGGFRVTGPNVTGTIRLSPSAMADEIGMHEQLLVVHLAAFDREVRCGDQAKQDDQLEMAARHASILTALKGMRN